MGTMKTETKPLVPGPERDKLMAPAKKVAAKLSSRRNPVCALELKAAVKAYEAAGG